MSSSPRVVYTDHGFPNVDTERSLIEDIGGTLEVVQARTPEDVAAASSSADALIVQWAPITAEVIDALDACSVIVRLGIGVDNVDLEAARAKGIPVCNVPDYCIDEVADHAVALALSLSRQIPQVDARVRSGTWKITPDAPMPALRASTFATVGFGRIAQAAHDRMRGFGCRLVAYDPFASSSAFEQAGVESVDLDTLFETADIISLHCPLTPETHHLVDADRLQTMKPTAILVNTARGGLIDTVALAEAMQRAEIGGAGIDVFEQEPMPDDHPLRASPNTLLTSHLSWFSDQSVPMLQRKAAEEVVRALRGEPLLHPVLPL